MGVTAARKVAQRGGRNGRDRRADAAHAQADMAMGRGGAARARGAWCLPCMHAHARLRGRPPHAASWKPVAAGGADSADVTPPAPHTPSRASLQGVTHVTCALWVLWRGTARRLRRAGALRLAARPRRRATGAGTPLPSCCAGGLGPEDPARSTAALCASHHQCPTRQRSGRLLPAHPPPLPPGPAARGRTLHKHGAAVTPPRQPGFLSPLPHCPSFPPPTPPAVLPPPPKHNGSLRWRLLHLACCQARLAP